MIDRALNVLVIAIVTSALAVLVVDLSQAWEHVEVWEQEWRPFATTTVKQDPTEVANAIRNAREAGAVADASKLESFLKEQFRPGTVKQRITAPEYLHALSNSTLILVFLLVPIAANYIRRGSWRVWNRAT